MNLRYLNYLKLVIDHGSFGAAALAGGVSQPAISHGMRQLQQQFDTPLFVRSGRRLVPTDAALRAALGASDLAVQINALATMPSAARHDTLRVGVTASAAMVCGSVLHTAWCADHPRRQLEMSSADEGRMLARLQGGELDLVIAPLPRGFVATGLSCELLYQITPQAYARRAHPLARADSLAELAGAAWAIVGPSVSGPVDVLREALAVRKMRPPRIAVSCPDYASLLGLMTRHDLLAVLPHPSLLASTAEGTVVPLHLREALPRYEMSLFAPRQLRRPLKAAINAIQQWAAQLGPER